MSCGTHFTTSWLPWFAWHPVGTITHGWRWLCWVERKRVMCNQDGPNSANRLVVLALSKAFRMIRDPSDGSVRETQHRPEALEAKALLDKTPVLSTTSSGLPAGSTKPERLAQLERSREWVRNYHAKKSHGETDGQ